MDIKEMQCIATEENLKEKEKQLADKEEALKDKEEQLARKEKQLNSREKQVFYALTNLESQLQFGLKDIETQSSISSNQTRLSYTTTFIFSAEAVFWGVLLDQCPAKWPIVIIVTVITIVIYELGFKRHNRLAMRLTTQKKDQEKIIRRVNVNVPSALSFAKASIDQFNDTDNTEIKQQLYFQIIDCTVEVLDVLSELFFDGFDQVVIGENETSKGNIPRYRVERILLDLRTVIVFLCEEAKKEPSDSLSPNALGEVMDSLLVGKMEIPLSIVGRFNAILDIARTNNYVGYIVNQGYCIPIDKAKYLV